MAAQRRLVVVGAGIGGLTAALALARRGHRVTVLERSAVLAEVGAGLQISPNASRILVELGLKPRLEAQAVTPDSLRIHSTRAGGEIARMPLGPPIAARFGAPYWVVHRADLQNALAAEVAALPSVSIRLGIAVKRIEAEPGRVVVAIEQDGRPDAIEADGVVGADGVWSMIRTGTLGAPPARYTGRMALRATIPIDETPPDYRNAVGLWMAPRAHLVHYPIAGGRLLNLVAVTEAAWEDDNWSVPVEREAVVRRFDPVSGTRWPDIARALILAPQHWTGWALAGIRPDFDWTSGPVTLLGDAAHATLPFAAQGACMAIEDAAVLARSLDRHAEVADGFAAYEKARKRRTTAIWDQAVSNGRIYHMGDALALFRDTGIGLAGRRLIDRQAWIYGWKPD